VPSAPRDASVRHLLAGAQIAGRYRLDRPLDLQSRVWRVFDRDGAARVLKSGLPELIRQEFHTLSALEHSNIVRVFDCVEDAAGAFLVLEDLPGGDLVSLAGLDPAIWLPAIADIVDALGYLHRQRLVHRDLKARNVLFDDSGSPRLIDFASTLGVGQAWTTGGTTPGIVAADRGTGPVACSDDIHALACLLHEMLYGSVPGQVAPGPIASRWRDLEALVNRALKPAPDAGPPDLGTFRSAIEWLVGQQRNQR